MAILILEEALMMVSSHPFCCFWSMKTVFLEFKEKNNLKPSELNFSENFNKKQLDINLNHLRLNSTLMNMQRCPQQTIKC